MGGYLRGVDREEPFDGLQLDEDAIVHDEIDSVRALDRESFVFEP